MRSGGSRHTLPGADSAGRSGFPPHPRAGAASGGGVAGGSSEMVFPAAPNWEWCEKQQNTTEFPLLPSPPHSRGQLCGLVGGWVEGLLPSFSCSSASLPRVSPADKQSEEKNNNVTPHPIPPPIPPPPRERPLPLSSS